MTGHGGVDPVRRGLLQAAGLTLLPRDVLARAAVPLKLQAQLLAKVSAYDRNMKKRAGDRVRVIVAQKEGSTGSRRVAKRFLSALESIDEIAGLPHESSRASFSSTTELREVVEKEQAAVVYLAGDMDELAREIREVLDGLSVLSVTSNPGDVRRGIVLGFDLIEARPKILIHLPAAKSQKVQFSTRLLKLAKVYR